MARSPSSREQWLEQLPSSFTYSQARDAGLSDWAIERLRDEQRIERLGRGLYGKASTDAIDQDLLAIATRAPAATLCLRSALARHGLIDDIPSTIDIALPQGTRPPALGGPISWHKFARLTFTIGREDLDLGEGITIGLYNADRCIIDAFRLRTNEGPELGNEALRRWLTRRGAQPGRLIRLASQFPRAETPLRRSLEVLL